MDNHWNELDDKKIATLNGLCVMNVLVLQKNVITEKDLLKCFITSSDEPHDLVERELKRILDIGVANGFIARDGVKYTLPSLADLNFEADCDDSGKDDKLNEKDKKCAKDERDDVTETPVSSTFTIKLDERPIVTARRSIKLEPGTEDSCAPSTSAAARNLDWNLNLNFYGFTKTDLKPTKRVAESSRTCEDSKRLKYEDFKKSVAEHRPIFPKSSDVHFPYPSASPGTSMVVEEEDESACHDEDESDSTDEDETPSRRRSTRKTRKPIPKCPPDCFK